MSSKIISPLDPTISNIQAPSNWAIMAVVEVLRLVVSVEGLLGLEGTGPGAVGFQAGELAGSAGVGTAMRGRVYVRMALGESRVGGGGGLLTCCRSTWGIRRI